MFCKCFILHVTAVLPAAFLTSLFAQPSAVTNSHTVLYIYIQTYMLTVCEQGAESMRIINITQKLNLAWLDFKGGLLFLLEQLKFLKFLLLLQQFYFELLPLLLKQIFGRLILLLLKQNFLASLSNTGGVFNPLYHSRHNAKDRQCHNRSATVELLWQLVREKLTIFHSASLFTPAGPETSIYLI